MVQTLPAETGRDLLRQVRTHPIETARPVMEATIQEATGVPVLILHHDISTASGAEVGWSSSWLPFPCIAKPREEIPAAT